MASPAGLCGPFSGACRALGAPPRSGASWSAPWGGLEGSEWWGEANPCAAWSQLPTPGSDGAALGAAGPQPRCCTSLCSETDGGPGSHNKSQQAPLYGPEVQVKNHSLIRTGNVSGTSEADMKKKRLSNQLLLVCGIAWLQVNWTHDFSFHAPLYSH